MRPLNWIPSVITLLACATAQAQVSLVPRRLSSGFQGQVPLLWVMEGRGALRGATFRLVDEGGKEVATWKDLEFRNVGEGRWQAWSLEVPGLRFKEVPEGRYTLACRMAWEQAGRLRQEETETALRLEGRGDGWLQKAFQGIGTEPVKVRAGLQWPKGGSLEVGLSATQGLRKVSYQIIAEQDEKVLRAWTELSLKEASTWKLKGEAAWPDGPAILWVLLEGEHGQAWVDTREVWLGRQARTGGSGSGPARPGAKRPLGGVAPVVAAPAYVDAPSVANAEWLRKIENLGTPLSWVNTNRVATVALGYWDAERNDTALFPTAAQMQWRPMSLSLSGANGLGKPLYGVSYLLATGINPDSVVDEATQAGFVMPQGAKNLQVGGALAPVVMSPGTVEDFLGKPLAAGYSWAVTQNDVYGYKGSGTDADGGPALMDAWTWSQQSDLVPPVGVNAIQAAARFRTNMQARVKADAGVTNSEADLDGTRDPFALSFASQDPMGRTVLAKGLGARKPELLDANLPPVNVAWSPIPSNRADNFDGELANWYMLNASAKHVYGPTNLKNGSIQLAPDFSVTVSILWWNFYLGHYDAGAFTANLGLLSPGSAPLSVNMNYQGSIKVSLVDDSGSSIWSQTYSSTTLAALPELKVGSGGVWAPLSPTQLRVVVTNATPTTTIAAGGSLPASSYVTLDDVSVASSQTFQGLKIPEATLDHASFPALPGYSRTQLGTVDKPGSVLDGYAVSQVTDGDGSAVAEIKDFEGRTVLKIVNPDSTYTNAFREYRLDADGVRKAFRPAAPKTRGLTGTVSSGPQINLVTQYMFDAEGHLRAVVPPKGLPANSWGLGLKDSDLEYVLSASTIDFNGVAGRAQEKAGYATFNAYDYAGNLVASYNPDEGLTRFMVDQKGRVHYSQTEKQRVTGGGTWTRTLYDGIFRVLAVGELNADVTPDAATLDSLPTYDPASSAFTTALDTLKPASRSQNTYDDYQGSDPTSDAGLDSKVQALLPKPALWGAFPDGKLTRTQDPRATERYYYDQDGRIIIRWVSLTSSGGTAKQFAIGIYYDFAGRVKRIVYPAGPGGDPLQVVYAYDDLGRLYAVGTPTDGTYFARYVYYPTGEVRAIVYGPGNGFAAKQMLQDPQGWLRNLTVKGR